MSEFLKCDAEGCDHEETVSEINAELVGKPCPVCGASLLSAEDLEYWITKVKPMRAMMKQLGIWAEPDEHQIADGSNIIQVGYHNGEVTIKAKV